MPQTINLNATTPAAPTGRVNATWQADSPDPDPNVIRAASCYVRNFGGVINETGATHTVAEADQGKCIALTNAGTKAITLPNTLGSLFSCAIANISGGDATLTPSTGTVNGAGSATCAVNSGGWLFFDGTNWQFIAGGSGSGSGARTTATVTTASLADLATENGTVSISKAFQLIRCVVDFKARVRLYSTSAARTADAARVFGDQVPSNSGLICDLLQSTTPLLDLELAPSGDGKNMDVSPSDTIYYAIQNVHGSTQTITAIFHYIPTEV